MGFPERNRRDEDSTKSMIKKMLELTAKQFGVTPEAMAKDNMTVDFGMPVNEFAQTIDYDKVFFSNNSAAITTASPDQQSSEESTKLAK